MLMLDIPVRVVKMPGVYYTALLFQQATMAMYARRTE